MGYSIFFLLFVWAFKKFVVKERIYKQKMEKILPSTYSIVLDQFSPNLTSEAELRVIVNGMF